WEAADMREIWTDTGSGRGRPAARSARGLIGRSLRCACASLLALLFLGLGAAPALALDPASLVKDIRPGSGNSGPTSLTNAAGTLFFGAKDDTHGVELWRSDGTAPGTKLVKDIRPGEGPYGKKSSIPAYLTNVAGTLFFAANDDTHGVELWRSDGTPAGTKLVKDIYPGGSSSPSFLMNVAGTLFFLADDGTHGTELWRSDGTAAGTTLVKDILPGTGNSGPTSLTNVAGTLFFAANDDTHGRELWKSDGTAVGTKLVKDIRPGGSSSPAYLTN